MKKVLLVLALALAVTPTAMASDIAFYVGSPNVDGWYDVATMNKDVATIISLSGHLFLDIQKFDDAHLAELGAWVDAPLRMTARWTFSGSTDACRAASIHTPTFNRMGRALRSGSTAAT